MSAEELEEWRKMPPYDKVQHANWKCRKMGYEELQKELNKHMEHDPIFKKFSVLVKKFVTEQNELSRMLAVDVALQTVENMSTKDAQKIASGVIDGIIQKCFNSKPKTKEVATEICLQFCEHERGEDVATALIEGAKNKNPKVAAASVEALKLCLENFGHKIISLKPIFAECPKLFQHRDKNVRGATRDLFVEAYCWVGAIVKQQLEKEPKIEHSIKECEEAWTDMKMKSKQKRFFKSQVEQREKAQAAAEGGEAEEEEEEDEEPVDMFEMLPETKILPTLSTKFKFEDEEIVFYDGMESKKWKVRGACLDLLNKSLGLDIVSLPDEIEKLPEIKLAAGDYGNLAIALKTCIKKDTNVLLLIKVFVGTALLAKALRDKFKNYATQIIIEILGRFKEKKPNVVKAGRMAADLAVKTIKFPDQLQDTLIERLADKNPSIRAETTLFIMRNLQPKTIKLGKPILKELMPKIIANCDHNDKTIRENTYKCLAVIQKKVGDKVMSVFTSEMKADKKKMIEDAVAELKNAGGDATAATVKAASPVKPKAEPKKAAPPSKKPVGKAAPAKKGPKKVSKKENSKTDEPIKEAEISDDVALDKCVELFGEEVVKEVQNTAWKARLAALETLRNKLAIMGNDIPAQAVFKLLSLKPGFKDTNFQCNMEKMKIIQVCGNTEKFSETSLNIVIDYCLDKIGDVKCGALSQEALSCMAEYLSLPFVISKVLPLGEKLKNVKNVAEIWSWISLALPQFGFGKFDIGAFAEASKKALSHTNANVRTKAIESIATVMRFLPQFKDFYTSEKDAIQKQIGEAFSKYDGQSPPIPSRGSVIRKAQGGAEEDDKEDDDNDDEMEDLMPRKDISGLLTEELLTKIGDSNWKMRREALDEIKTIFETNKFVTANLGHLPPALAKRLSDVNKVLLTTTIEIWILIAASLGAKGAKQHIKAVVVPMIGVFADSKVQLREKAAAALSSWLELVPMKFWFDDESISETLGDAKKVHLRYSFLNWLGEKLKDQKKVPTIGLEACLKNLYACYEDRDGKVREAAGNAFYGFMLHVGWQKMCKAAGNNQKIRDHLDKIKETLPKVEIKAEVIDVGTIMNQAASKKAPKKAAPKAEEMEMSDTEGSEAPVKEVKAKKVTKKIAGKGVKTVKGKPVVAEDLGDIIIGTDKLKSQREKDDTKLKTLKWTFDAGTAPRGELIDQLKIQCQTAFGAKFLEFFHKTDGPSQTKAIGLLENEELEKLKSVVDLILRWSTVRFSEKNTTVLTRLLIWLQKLFNQLNEADYRMLGFEATAFLPHLISKLGEGRQEVRDSVHDMLRSMVFIYSNQKIFEEILQGVKSKNSRCRTECLKHLGEMIANHGLSVLGPPKAMALKDIAAQISDRDQNVRSGALNALVEVHRHIGDEVFNPKKIGRLGEKEDSYLRERIKRACKDGGVSADLTKTMNSGTFVKPRAVGTSKDRRGTVTLPKGASNIKREDSSPAPSPLPPTPEPEGRFKIIEPAPATVQVPTYEELQLASVDMDGLMDDIPEPKLKYIQGDKDKMKRTCRELNAAISTYSENGMASDILKDVKLQISSGDLNRIMCGLVAAANYVKRQPKLDIDDEVADLMKVTARLLDTKVSEMLTDVEEPSTIIKLIKFISILTSQIVKNFARVIDGASFSILTGAVIRLLVKRSFLAQCQSVDPSIAPMLNQMLKFSMDNVSFSSVIQGFIKLAHEMINCVDENILKAYVRAYFKALSIFDQSSFAWSSDHFCDTYDLLVEFITIYPKHDPAYEVKSKMDILRCHVTFCNKFVRRYPSQAKVVIADKQSGNVIYDRITRELQNQNSDDKENMMDPLRMELSRLLRQAQNQSTSNKAMNDIYAFKKRNPDFNMDNILGEQSKYITLFVKRKLEMMAWNEANNMENTINETQTQHGLTYYEDQLNSYREKLGIGPLQTEQPSPLKSKAVVQEEETEEETVSLEMESPKKRMTAEQLEALRARLNKLRK